MKYRFIRWIILLIIGFGIGSVIGYLMSKNELDSGVIEISPDDTGNATILKQPTSTENAHQKSDVGGDFSLIDHNGNDVTQENYADSYKLVFFGFTFCPAICPTELQKVSAIMDQLGADADKITPLFITVDPERDNVETMKQYVEQFHPKLVGLTGSAEQIDAVKDAYRVYATKVENEMMEGYMMDHSAFLYLMTPDDNMIALYPSKDTAQDIATDIQTRL